MSRSPGLTERLDLLEEALEAGRGALPPALLDEADLLVTTARERVGLGGEVTVVALAGATGSGKSSLFNALAGRELAPAGPTRPTTGEPAAALWANEPDVAHELLDWLDVGMRHALPPTDRRPADRASADRVPADLVLLDLPDHDSVAVAHREVAERLYQRVDLLVWVLDPQKYADGVLHERYLRPLAALAPVMVLVLNQADRLTPDERAACLQDLRRLAAADGLGRVPVLAVSARTGEGVDELRGLLAEATARRRAMADRWTAQVAALASRLLEACGRQPSGADAREADLVRALERAAGLPVVVQAVRDSLARQARAATGWPPVRWVGRLRPDPLRRLHLGARTLARPELVRTSLPPPSPAARAGATGAVRAYLDGATGGAPDVWVLQVRARVTSQGLGDALDQAVAGTPVLPPRPPRWWRATGVLQWGLLVTALVGVAWLVGQPLVERALLVQVQPPVWGGLPVPTWLAVGGVLAGWLVAALAAGLGVLGARRRANRAARALHRSVVEVARNEVVDPVSAELGRLERCRAAAARAAA